MSNESFGGFSWLLVVCSVASLIFGVLGYRRSFAGFNGATALLLVAIWIGVVSTNGGPGETSGVEMLFYVLEFLILLLCAATVAGRQVQPALPWLGWTLNAFLSAGTYALAHMGPLRLW